MADLWRGGDELESFADRAILSADGYTDDGHGLFLWSTRSKPVTFPFDSRFPKHRFRPLHMSDGINSWTEVRSEGGTEKRKERVAVGMSEERDWKMADAGLGRVNVFLPGYVLVSTVNGRAVLTKKHCNSPTSNRSDSSRTAMTQKAHGHFSAQRKN